MPTYEVQMTHVNRDANNLTLHVEAENKIEAADYINERFGYPTEIAYSMFEIDRPLTSWEKVLKKIDADIIAQRRFGSFLRELDNSFSQLKNYTS